MPEPLYSLSSRTQGQHGRHGCVHSNSSIFQSYGKSIGASVSSLKKGSGMQPAAQTAFASHYSFNPQSFLPQPYPERYPDRSAQVQRYKNSDRASQPGMASYSGLRDQRPSLYPFVFPVQLRLPESQSKKCAPRLEKKSSIESDSTTASSDDYVFDAILDSHKNDVLASILREERAAGAPLLRPEKEDPLLSEMEELRQVAERPSSVSFHSLPKNFDIIKETSKGVLDTKGLLSVGLSIQYDREKSLKHFYAHPTQRSHILSKYYQKNAYNGLWQKESHKHESTIKRLCVSHRLERRKREMKIQSEQTKLIQEGVPYSTHFESLPSNYQHVLLDFKKQNNEVLTASTADDSKNSYASIEDWYVKHPQLWKKIQDHCNMKCSSEEYIDRYAITTEFDLHSTESSDKKNDRHDSEGSTTEEVSSPVSHNSPPFLSCDLQKEEKGRRAVQSSETSVSSTPESIESSLSSLLVSLKSGFFEHKKPDGPSEHSSTLSEDSPSLSSVQDNHWTQLNNLIWNKDFIQDNKQHIGILSRSPFISLDEMIFQFSEEAKQSYSIPDLNHLSISLTTQSLSTTLQPEEGFALLYGYQLHYYIKKSSIILGQLDASIRHQLNEFCYQSNYHDCFSIDVDLNLPFYSFGSTPLISSQCVSIFCYQGQWYLRRIQSNYVYIAVNNHMIIDCNEWYPLQPQSLIYIHSYPFYFLQAKK